MATVPGPEAKSASSLSPQAVASSVTNDSDSGAPPIKRRAPIACRRCRRMRSKCIHEKAPPCKSCREANVPEECVFPTRGESDQDRLYRHPRQRADRKTRGDISVKGESPTSPGLVHDVFADYRPPKVENEWDLLPSIDIVVDGIDALTRNFFQISFLPKRHFPKMVKENPTSVSVFLLLSILSVSARFSKTFTEIYSDGLKATTEFMHKAQYLAIHELYQQPTLERCQGFYLLSIAEQGCGKSNTSYISVGIAFRMAALMRLHREEAYSLVTAYSPIKHRFRAESARRTFWMLHSQDNLHSGPYKPLSLAPGDITALLPSDEVEFLNGNIPPKRAALEGTPPALQDPGLTILRPRSLFASLMQIHNIWGVIARRVLFNQKCGRPSDGSSEYARLNRKLMDFEQNLPSDHTFGKILLGGYKHYEEDLAYLSLTGCIRLCNIVLRREYIEDMIRYAGGNPSNPEVMFYKTMARELFCNVRTLYSQIEAHYEDGIRVERIGSQMSGFIIYSCGLLASYLCKFPQLDVHHPEQDIKAIQEEGRTMYTRIVTVLRVCQLVWPLAETWCNGLEKWYEDSNLERRTFQGGTMTDGKEPQPHALSVMHPRTTTSCLQSEVLSLTRLRNTSPMALAEERRQSVVEEVPEPHRLAPLQQTQPGYAQPVCLPPLSQTPYGAHHQQPTPPPPYPPVPQNYPQQVYPTSGLSMTPPPAAINPYQPQTTGYYPEYPVTAALNDGFDGNLQMLVDGARGQWPATDLTGVVYNTYEVPSYLPQP